MNHGKHTYLMIGLAVVAGILLLTGTSGGGAFLFIWLAGCVAMMFFMMRGMGGMDHAGTRKDETREDETRKDETRNKVDHSKH